MKKIKYVLLAIIAVYVFIVYLYNTNLPCKIEDCKNKSIQDGKYCIEHTCEWEGCYNNKGAGKVHYCYYHVEQNAKENQHEEIVLTDTQVNEAKRAITEYAEKLMNKQSNILAINLINDYPEYVSEHFCSFRCNVVREDSNTNLGTLHLSINDDGSFKVDNLLYDE